MDDAFRGNGPWKIKLAKPDKIIKQLGRSQQGEYDKFKNAIYHGESTLPRPREAWITLFQKCCKASQRLVETPKATQPTK
jgi:hypothetical protein